MTDDNDSNEGEPMELVMPFIVCASKGGPYDDGAFVAGYQAGVIDRSLAVLATVEGARQYGPVSVHTQLVAQLDLVAMRHGFTVDAEPSEAYPEWTAWTAVRS